MITFTWQPVDPSGLINAGGRAQAARAVPISLRTRQQEAGFEPPAVLGACGPGAAPRLRPSDGGSG